MQTITQISLRLNEEIVENELTRENVSRQLAAGTADCGSLSGRNIQFHSSLSNLITGDWALDEQWR